MARPRSNSGSTVRAPSISHGVDKISKTDIGKAAKSLKATVSIHDDSISRESVIFSDSFLVTSGLVTDDLVEICLILVATAARDFENKAEFAFKNEDLSSTNISNNTSQRTYLCVVKKRGADPGPKLQDFEISVNKHIANIYDFTSRSQVQISLAHKSQWTASHVEITFRDAYLSRSDMWRFTNQELVGKTLHVGQKLSFLGSLRASVKKLHVHGQHSHVAYFDSSTVPVFRSEAARFLIFIQMSREMWDFDSEGDGEILFNRVVNGFLPELFKRWSELDVRHLVSIVMFGRVEYQNLAHVKGVSDLTAISSYSSISKSLEHQDFYRVVVTDMASAQWTTILEELKKDFRVFLRDVSLFKRSNTTANDNLPEGKLSSINRIKGRLSGALKGNILEAINLAASQFSNDYIDRDLIRTGISTVIVTAGSGVFDVDRDLLRLTSETLTDNGIGIDVVCLSKMPLHSVPLFRYRLPQSEDRESVNATSPSSLSMNPHLSLPDLSHSPAFSLTNSSANYFSRFPSAFPARLPQTYGYGIPQWIDLSYWSSEMSNDRTKRDDQRPVAKPRHLRTARLFVPRVRMYELQMMGLMELGMADIVIPYLTDETAKGNLSVVDQSSRLSRSYRHRSLSQSPEIYRKDPSDMRPRRSRMYRHRELPQSDSNFTEVMNQYDDAVYVCHTRKPEKVELPKDKVVRKRIKPGLSNNAPAMKSSMLGSLQHASAKIDNWTDNKSDTESISSNTSKTPRPRAPRNISYTFRGLAPLKASVATPELRVENVNAQKISNTGDRGDNDDNSVNDIQALRSPEKGRDRNNPDANVNKGQQIPSKSEEGSRPIKIRSVTGVGTRKGDNMRDDAWHTHLNQNEPLKDAKKRTNRPYPESEKLSNTSHSLGSIPDSIPHNTIPFVRNVNASNPLKGKLDVSTFGRWQHLYPRKPKAATVKWKSLCTPASVPLTTEDFPSSEELESNYEALCYIVRTIKDDENQQSLQNDTYSFFLEMVSLRIAHGYQFVVGDGLGLALEDELLDPQAIFGQQAREKARGVVVMIMGNAIQKLELHNSLSVRVTMYALKHHEETGGAKSSVAYDMLLRTILSNGYFSRDLLLDGSSQKYPWQAADNHLAGSADESTKFVEQLRYWRARFVLIPVEPPANTWKLSQADENDEEIHILGIRALTQLWQKNRYVTPQERSIMQNRVGSIKRQDINPLEVKMETLNPSELVTLELDKLSQIEEGVESDLLQLLPEPQKFDRETSMLQKLAQALQTEQGIEIKNRRWHLRLYYNCFHGEEFTNWLMHNVKNMKNREDAVDFGNQLMKEGLFEHVSDRHRFKDGHYFYSIKPEYRIAKPDLQKSWFPNSRQSNKSIPPTPASEQSSKELSPLSVRTRSGSNLVKQSHSQMSDSKSSGERKRKSVSLSKLIRVDVDSRKKSFLGRPEVVDVHYDRFHNPENCYHIELNWLNTTCKLVDDAISTWTNTAERYGLKLVEVPIAEALDVPKSEPFRQSYRIKLALEPPIPKQGLTNLNNSIYSATAFAPHTPTGGPNQVKHVYQKAILKRSNFVLDFEAAHEFPEGVEIDYSWGRLKYKNTQFIHRSGVVLAQILDNGDIILLANRLYNSRLANTKDASNRPIDQKRDVGPHSHRPAVPPSAVVSMQASGIVGINLASPSTTFTSSPGLAPLPNIGLLSSPNPRPLNYAPTSSPSNDLNKNVIADSFGPKSNFAATGLWNSLITPEQIKDDLEAFCLDKSRLESFYQEVAITTAPTVSSIPGSGSRRATGSSSSSLLKPVREVPGITSDITGMPAFELPEAVTAVKELRRATAIYDNAAEQNERGNKGRQGSGSSMARTETDFSMREHSTNKTPSPMRKVSK